MLNEDAKKKKDPQLTELAGLMNVKDFSLTIVLAEAVGFLLSVETRMNSGLASSRITVYPYRYPYTYWSRQDSPRRSCTYCPGLPKD
jgi:hypothetical protein